MTGFAAGRAEGLGYGWSWDLRAVNGKGFDLRLRLPDWIDGLEAAVRGAVGAQVVRGSVTLGLRIAREGSGEALRVNPQGLHAALAACGLLVILSSPSGAGKSTLARRLMDWDPEPALFGFGHHPQAAPRRGRGRDITISAAPSPSSKRHGRRGRDAGTCRGVRQFLRHAARPRSRRRCAPGATRCSMWTGRAASRSASALGGHVVSIFVLPPSLAELERR
jgi:hypothetical protein